MSERIRKWNSAARRLAASERAIAKGRWSVVVIPKMPGHLRHPDGGAAVTLPLFRDGEEVWERLYEARAFGNN